VREELEIASGGRSRYSVKAEPNPRLPLRCAAASLAVAASTECASGLCLSPGRVGLVVSPQAIIGTIAAQRSADHPVVQRLGWLQRRVKACVPHAWCVGSRPRQPLEGQSDARHMPTAGVWLTRARNRAERT
jgi:hypothetical protein